MAGNFAGIVKRAVVQIGATGVVIPAVAGKKIRVLAVYLNSAGTVNAYFESGVGSPTVQLSGFLYLVANAGAVLPFNEAGWFDTVVGDPLAMVFSAAVQIGGVINYTEV